MAAWAGLGQARHYRGFWHCARPRVQLRGLHHGRGAQLLWRAYPPRAGQPARRRVLAWRAYRLHAELRAGHLGLVSRGLWLRVQLGGEPRAVAWRGLWRAFPPRAGLGARALFALSDGP